MIRAFGFRPETLHVDIEKAFTLLLRCSSYFPCLHAGRLGGKTRVDLQVTVEDSDPIDSPDLNGGAGITISVSSSDITFALNINELTAETPVSADQFAFADASDSQNPKKVTLANLGAAIGSAVDHGTLAGLGDDDHTQYMKDAGTSTAGNVPSFTNTDGRTMQDSGVLAADLVDGPAAAISGNLASYNGTSGKVIQDSGVVAADVATSTDAITDNTLVRGDGGSKGLQETGITVDDGDNMSGVEQLGSGEHTVTVLSGDASRRDIGTATNDDATKSWFPFKAVNPSAGTAQTIANLTIANDSIYTLQVEATVKRTDSGGTGQTFFGRWNIQAVAAAVTITADPNNRNFGPLATAAIAVAATKGGTPVVVSLVGVGVEVRATMGQYSFEGPLNA
jgi:hypothetical protein